jgi:hypothetical protein
MVNIRASEVSALALTSVAIANAAMLVHITEPTGNSF